MITRSHVKLKGHHTQRYLKTQTNGILEWIKHAYLIILTFITIDTIQNKNAVISQPNKMSNRGIAKHIIAYTGYISMMFVTFWYHVSKYTSYKTVSKYKYTFSSYQMQHCIPCVESQ